MIANMHTRIDKFVEVVDKLKTYTIDPEYFPEENMSRRSKLHQIRKDLGFSTLSYDKCKLNCGRSVGIYYNDRYRS